MKLYVDQAAIPLSKKWMLIWSALYWLPATSWCLAVFLAHFIKTLNRLDFHHFWCLYLIALAGCSTIAVAAPNPVRKKVELVLTGLLGITLTSSLAGIVTTIAMLMLHGFRS